MLFVYSDFFQTFETMFFELAILFCSIFLCVGMDDAPKNCGGKGKQIVEIDDDYYTHYITDLLDTDEDEFDKMEAMAEGEAIEKRGEQQKEEQKRREEKQKGMKKVTKEQQTKKRKGKTLTRSIPLTENNSREEGAMKVKLTNKGGKRQLNALQKEKGKKPMGENHTKIEVPKMEKVAELVEQFVKKSNKRWAHISEMVEVLLVKELEEKRQRLAIRNKDDGIALHLLAPIEHVYGKRRNALIMSGQTIDTVLFGIEISLSFLQVPVEILEDEMNECTRLIIQHSACKLVKAAPIFAELSKNVHLFGELLANKIGVDNAKTVGMVRHIMRFIQSADTLLSSKWDSHKDGGNAEGEMTQGEVEASLDDDADDENDGQLHNLIIYIQFYQSLVRICNVYHMEPNVSSEHILRDVFGTLLAIASAIVGQFSDYCAMAKRDGFGRMKDTICQ